MLSIRYGSRAEERIEGYPVLEAALQHLYVYQGSRDEPTDGQRIARFQDREWRMSRGVPGDTKATTQFVVLEQSGEPLDAWVNSQCIGRAPVFVLRASGGEDGYIALLGAEGVGGNGKPWGVTDTVCWMDRSGGWHNYAGELEVGPEIATEEFFTGLPRLPYVAPPGRILRPSALSARLIPSV